MSRTLERSPSNEDDDNNQSDILADGITRDFDGSFYYRYYFGQYSFLGAPCSVDNIYTRGFPGSDKIPALCPARNRRAELTATNEHSPLTITWVSANSQASWLSTSALIGQTETSSAVFVERTYRRVSIFSHIYGETARKQDGTGRKTSGYSQFLRQCPSVLASFTFPRFSF